MKRKRPVDSYVALALPCDAASLNRFSFRCPVATSALRALALFIELRKVMYL
jgi:hypothetical protein